MKKSVLLIMMLFSSGPLEASTPISVNTSPVVAITSPANGRTFTAGSNIIITATASEANGTIREAYFFDGTYYLGSSITSPYTYTWANAPAGSHSLIVEATDNKGGTLISAPINITVNPAPSPATTPLAGAEGKK